MNKAKKSRLPVPYSTIFPDLIISKIMKSNIHKILNVNLTSFVFLKKILFNIALTETTKSENFAENEITFLETFLFT